MNLSSLTLYAGTKWSWTENPAQYLAPVYFFKIFLKLKNNPAIELSSIADGTGFKFKVSLASTNITPGNYSFQAQAFNSSGEIFLVEAA